MRFESPNKIVVSRDIIMDVKVNHLCVTKNSHSGFFSGDYFFEKRGKKIQNSLENCFTK